MHLSKLINVSRDVEIEGLTADSRQVKKNYLFAALPGAKEHGAKYIEDALMHGASVILAAPGTKLPDGADAVLIEDINPRLRLSRMAAQFYDIQPRVIVAVTGTSGKTSTVTFTQQLWELYGIEKSVSLGTLGIHGAGYKKSGALTTPDAVSLHAALADMAAADVTHLAMEASSHGLDQYRLHGVRVTAAGYTNLSRDHLDYHADMNEYFAAKMKLFSDVLGARGVAVLNADDEYFEKVEHVCLKNHHKVITYGKKGEHIRILERVLVPGGQRLKLYVMGHPFEITLPLVGHFQMMNALCALGLVLVGDGEPETVTPLLEKLQGVPGRLQLVPGHPSGAAVYVDYAHKPAAVEAVLNTLRPHTEGRLFCLLGCGGNRDAGKRPIMGRIAAGLSDVVIVTDDNPRNENAADIRAAVMEGAPDAHEIAGRGKAIEWAVSQLKKGDVLVIAGKGHERGQIVGDVVEPFDDVEETEKSIERLG